MSVPEHIINKKLSVSEQAMFVPERAIYLLNAVCSRTNTACSGTDDSLTERCLFGTDIACYGTSNKPKANKPVPEQIIYKKLSVLEQAMFVPERAIYLLNAVSSTTNTACSGTDNY